MNVNDLMRALTAFADDASNLDLSGGHLMVQIGDDLIDADVEEREGTLYVIEGGEKNTAFRWLVNRIARIPQLAERILTHVAREDYFVRPSGTLLNYLNESPDETEFEIDDIPGKMPELLQAKAGTSSVLYITSEAGEGKTTLINELARLQAEKFKAKRTSWLLVPISLGGRAFMTFDDIVVAELVNKLRFHLFHYEAFLEMVRLGVLVPAFDGFEEMFVAGASGEVLSALGNLITDLDSSGSVLVAARIAYFKYRNFRLQARLFDAIRDGSVDFAQLDLHRWNKSQFLKYARKRKLPDGESIYEQVRTALGQDEHPLLTRAVLVARLLDVAADDGIDGLLAQLRANRDDYFHQFICTMVEREATKKWIDQNTPHQPLISPEEHHELLAALAKEMWMTSSDALRGDYLDLIADLFADDIGKPLQLKRQIIQRLRHHALISKSVGSDTYTFDHDDFQRYYLGVAIANLINGADLEELNMSLGRAELSPISIDSTLNAIKRNGRDLLGTLSLLQSLTVMSAATNYAADNSASLAARLLEMICPDRPVTLTSFIFPPESLSGRHYGRVTFKNCEFQQTSLTDSKIAGCCFIKCTIHQLVIPEGFNSGGAVVESCDIRCVVTSVGHVYDPVFIQNLLVDAGFQVTEVEEKECVTSLQEPDEETRIAERALRVFMRATQINENVFRQKFGGSQGSVFFRIVLDRMLEKGVLEQVQFRGRGTHQKRYKLGVEMRKIDAAIAVPRDVFTLDEFLESVVAGYSRRD